MRECMLNVTDHQWTSESNAGDMGRPFIVINTAKGPVYTTFNCFKTVHEHAILFQTIQNSQPMTEHGVIIYLEDVVRYGMSVKSTWQHTTQL